MRTVRDLVALLGFLAAAVLTLVVLIAHPANEVDYLCGAILAILTVMLVSITDVVRV